MTTDFVSIDELLFKVHTPYGYYYTSKYETALKYYEENSGFVLMGYTTNLFPKWYVIKDKKRKGNNWFISFIRDIINVET